MALNGRLCACAEDDRRSIGGGVVRRSTGTARRYLFWKGLLDRLTAAVLLVPGLPLLGLLIVLVRATSRGPGIYRQVRVGKDGREFTMYKLRSMRQDAEAGTGAVWSTSHDNRVTPLGRFLRRSHLDELPQLFNVLWGEMSLIGPRPERPEFVCVLEEQIDGYRDRLAVPPGVTGLAQINLPPDTDLTSVRRKQVLDLLYIDTASAWLDCR
ncbi:MAG: sugar transferase, partial [Pirellulaceae bacterium]|nr:sugar transferase [Pirellulaceae bacterium]